MEEEEVLYLEALADSSDSDDAEPPPGLTKEWLSLPKNVERSDSELGKELGVHGTKVASHRKKYGLAPSAFRQLNVQAGLLLKGLTKEWLCLPKNVERSDTELGNELGVAGRTVANHRKKYGLAPSAFRQPNVQAGLLLKGLTKEWLCLPKNVERSDTELGNELGVAGKTVASHRKKYGLAPSVFRQPNVQAGLLLKGLTKEWLSLPKNVERSNSELGKELGVTDKTVASHRKKYGLAPSAWGRAFRMSKAPL
ncbi:hypothetical protein T484DRAFT_1941708 [Baffinella frigidus]|nr:hypothetical protein T484DRAFT_1941708 [Cryptophyta sp. CCMP2293]